MNVFKSLFHNLMLLEKYNDIAGSSDKKHAQLFSIGKTSKSSIPSKASVQAFV